MGSIRPGLSALDADDLAERVNRLNQVRLRRHYGVNVLVCARRLVDHVGVLPALHALGRPRVVFEREPLLGLGARHRPAGPMRTGMKAICVALAAIVALAGAAHAEIVGTAHVIDGDTIEVQGQRIRLHGIDGPEGRQLCFDDGDPWLCGTDAANALRNKIGDRQVTCEELDRDCYERVVAKCPVDGEDLGEWMVLRGWAKRYHYDCHDQLHTHLADFVSAYNFARRLRTLKSLTPTNTSA